MSPVWTLVFFLATLPFCVLCAAFDLTQMKIPNWVVLGLFACFLLLGGGDGKFAAAAAAFIAPGDYGVIMVTLAVMSLLAVWLHRMMGRVRALQSVTQGWESYRDVKKFPFGLPLAATLVFYNLLMIRNAL